MTGRPLILSIFPGIDLLGRAFEEVWPEACLVRGPDLLWGGDIKTFHPPAGVFDGVIGGPPCQAFSRFRYLNPHAGRHHGNLIPEFERVCNEAAPRWFLMENVPEAPEPVVTGYVVKSERLNNRWLGEEQHRVRRFSFGTPVGHRLLVETSALEAPLFARAVTCDARQIPVALVRDGKGGHKPKAAVVKPPTVIAGHGTAFDRDRMSIQEMCRLQGLPETALDDTPFTAHGRRLVIGNGVPLAMGRAVARAVRRAVEQAP